MGACSQGLLLKGRPNNPTSSANISKEGVIMPPPPTASLSCSGRGLNSSTKVSELTEHITSTLPYPHISSLQLHAKLATPQDTEGGCVRIEGPTCGRAPAAFELKTGLGANHVAYFRTRPGGLYSAPTGDMGRNTAIVVSPPPVDKANRSATLSTPPNKTIPGSPAKKERTP